MEESVATSCSTGVIDDSEEEDKKNTMLRLVAGRVLNIGGGVSIIPAVPLP